MWKLLFSIIKSFLKLSFACFLVFLIIELLEVYLWDDKNIVHDSEGFRDKEYSVNGGLKMYRYGGVKVYHLV